MKHFLTAAVLTAAAGFVVVLDQHPSGARDFLLMLLVLSIPAIWKPK